MNLKIKDILKCTNGNLIIGNKEKECKNYSEDTRTLNIGDVFIGIKGERVDGSSLWKNAFDKGADTVIINNNINLEKEEIEKYEKEGKNIIQVEDTMAALGKMASYKRNFYDGKIKVIGITGSVGKTSTKDIIANVISQKYKTLKTEGNNNSYVGLPLTILRLKDEEVAVIEMGMNHLGEISYLSKIAKPDISVITNIGTAHIGLLGSRENILKAKLEILDGMKKKILIINNDNDLLNKWNLENKENIEVYTYGINEESDFKGIDINLEEKNSSFTYKNKDKKIKIKVPVSGEHFILNSLSAIAVAKLLDINEEDIRKGIENFKLTAKRMETHYLKNDIIIIDDSYNASYESMKASLVNLKNIHAKRKIAVLGDMLELGDFTEELHRKVGIEVNNNNVDKLFVVGNYAKYISDEAIKNGMNKENVVYFENNDLLFDYLKENIKEGDAIWFKASNAMRLFSVAEKLKAYIENN